MNTLKSAAVICAVCLLEANCRLPALNSTAPEKRKQVAYAHLKHSAFDFLGMPWKELTLSEAHEFYFVDANVLTNGQCLSGARLFSWQYFVLRKGSAVAEIHLNADERTGPLLNVLGMSAGPLVVAMYEASKVVEAHPPVKKMNYELRLLNAPSLHFAAVWVHWNSDDILIPVDAVGLLPKGLPPNRTYSEADVIKVLKPIAEQTIKAFREAPPNAVQ